MTLAGVYNRTFAARFSEERKTDEKSCWELVSAREKQQAEHLFLLIPRSRMFLPSFLSLSIYSFLLFLLSTEIPSSVDIITLATPTFFFLSFSSPTGIRSMSRFFVFPSLTHFITSDPVISDPNDCHANGCCLTFPFSLSLSLSQK